MSAPSRICLGSRRTGGSGGGSGASSKSFPRPPDAGTISCAGVTTGGGGSTGGNTGGLVFGSTGLAVPPADRGADLAAAEGFSADLAATGSAAATSPSPDKRKTARSGRSMRIACQRIVRGISRRDAGCSQAYIWTQRKRAKTQTCNGTKPRERSFHIEDRHTRREVSRSGAACPHLTLGVGADRRKVGQVDRDTQSCCAPTLREARSGRSASLTRQLRLG